MFFKKKNRAPSLSEEERAYFQELREALASQNARMDAIHQELEQLKQSGCYLEGSGDGSGRMKPEIHRSEESGNGSDGVKTELRQPEEPGDGSDRAKTADRQMEELRRELEKLRMTVGRHDMSLEDMLEGWEEKNREEEAAQHRIRELEQNEKGLLSLFGAYLDQFFAMRRFARSKDEEWSGQLEMMETQLEHFRKLCGIVIIDGCGDRVDYELHEVVQMVETEEAERDQTISDVYRCGYIYKGTVMRKAQVAACHMKELMD